MVALSKPAPASHSFAALKEKQRAIREGFPQALGLRVHRSLSWLGRAEAEADDNDVRFVLLWVGFNAAYAGDLSEEFNGERSSIEAYFNALVHLDAGHRIYNALWFRFSQEIRLLLDNKYVFSPFWKHHNGVEGYEDWQDRLTKSGRAVAAALTQQNTSKVLQVVFDRLYVLRNQLVHGGATWNSGANRDQVRDGAAVLGTLLPLFIDIMMDNPARDWGRPFYPVVD